MMSAHCGEVICTVTTAQPLDAANLKDLRVALNGFLAKGETLKLETKSDPLHPGWNDSQRQGQACGHFYQDKDPETDQDH
eukprot:XP_014054127.1 PREDICTED: ATP synthase subunit O, mitochondrial-like [Salmo salar]